MDQLRKQAGFTMVELITSIVIIGILSAALEPRFIGNNAFAERGYTDEVAAALRYAQAVAVANGCGVTMTINAANYQALQPPNAGCGARNQAVIQVDGSPLSGNAPNGVTLTPAIIAFNAQGRIPNNVPLVLTSGAGGTSSLTINAFSGLVVVQ